MTHKKNHTFPVVIIALSTWTLANFSVHLQDLYSVLSVAVGLTAVCFYYKNIRSYDKLIYFWIFLQVPNIVYNDFPVMASFPLSFGLGMTLGLKNDKSLELYFNVLPVGLYYLFKYLNVEKPVGHSIVISRLKRDTFPQIQFPVKGIIENISERKKIVGIYSVCLENEIIIRDKSYRHILLEPKNDTLIKPGEKNQIAALCLCDKPKTFINWVTIECI
jgi:hypothetical protein